jgi:hypothetical protein
MRAQTPGWAWISATVACQSIPADESPPCRRRGGGAPPHSIGAGERLMRRAGLARTIARYSCVTVPTGRTISVQMARGVSDLSVVAPGGNARTTTRT